jgi:ribose/xylose/arabinose/galactoside ABC-type transport system permease subunit
MNSQINNRVARWAASHTTELALFFLIFAFSFFIKGFLSLSNFKNLLGQVAPLLLLAAGQGVVIIVGGLDLSQGSIVGLISVVFFAAANAFDFPVALLIVAAVCILIGALNAYCTIKLKNSFIASFAAMYIISGITIYKTGGTPISSIPATVSRILIWLGTASFCGVPVVFFAACMAVGVLALFLNYTKLGLHIYAFGCNPAAARIHGVRELAVWTSAFCVSALFSGLAAIVLSARVLQGNPQMGEGLLFESIAACVVGGIALSGGVGGVWFILRGVILMIVIQNGLYLSDLNSHFRDVVVGGMLIISVFSSRVKLPFWRIKRSNGGTDSGATGGFNTAANIQHPELGKIKGEL